MPVNWKKVNKKRFWSKVKKTKGCWLWTAGLFPVHGYGQFHVGGYPTQAHRVSWFLRTGKPPVDICVLHTCDNRICVNPKHLFLGTRGDNNRDTVSKLRHVYGEQHWKNVLSISDVKEICKRYKQGELQKELGEEFGVGQPHISTLVRGKAWRQLGVAHG
jgi:hypothetical protein